VGSPAELAGTLSAPVLTDVVPDAGPLGGLHAGLLAARDREHEAVFLLACDMPLVSPGMVDAVAREGERGNRPMAAPVEPSGEPHPLCAWYSVHCLTSVTERLSGPDRSLRGLLGDLKPLMVSTELLEEVCDPEIALRSANTRDELALLERLASAQPIPVADLPEGRSRSLPPILCIVGYKDSGKTTVAVELVAELRRRGHEVAVVKHGHGFRLDTPGTDSWRLRHEGGADPVLLAGPEGFAMMGSWKGRGVDDGEPDLETLVRQHLSHAGVVIVEGYKGSSFPKVEVFRGNLHPEPFFQSGQEGAEGVVAVVTDEVELAAPVPVLPLSAEDLTVRLADLVEQEVLGR